MQDILQKQIAVTNEKLDLSNNHLMRIRSLTESVLYSVRGQFSNTERLLEYAEEEAKFRTTERTLEAERDRAAMVKALEKIAENTDSEKQGPEKKDKDMNLGAWGLAIAAALGGIVGAITGYVQAIVKLNKILFSAIGSAANAIVQFFPGLKRMLFNIQANIAVGMAMIKDSVKTVFGKIVEKFAAVVDVVDDAIRRVLNGKVIKSIVEVFNKVVTSIKAFFAPIVEAFKTIGSASGSVGGIVATIKSKIGTLLEMFSNIGKYFTTFSKVFTAVATIAKKIALPLTIIMTAWDVIKGIMSGWEEGGLIGAIGGAVKGLFNSLVFGVADMIKGAISWIAGALGFEGVEKFLDSFSFKDLFSDFVDAVLFIPQTIQNIIMNPIDTLKKLGATLKNAFDAVVSKFMVFVDVLSGLGDLVMDYIIDPLMKAFEPIADFFKGVKDQIVSFVENFGIPEISFTIPIIDKKVSIGPFYPFKPGGSPKSSDEDSSLSSVVGESLARAGNKVGDLAWMAKENAANLIDANTGGALTKTGNAISGAKNKVLGMFGMGEQTMDNGDGTRTTFKSDGTRVIEGPSGTKVLDKDGKLISEKSPTFMGASTERREDGSVIESYDSGPLSLRKETTAAGGSRSTASYDIGITKLAVRETLTPRQMRERAIDERMAAGLPSKIPVEGGAPASTAAIISAAPSAPTAAAPAESGTAKRVSKIAGEPWSPGQDLSKNQLAELEKGIASGVNYSFRVMEQYDKQKGNARAGVTGGAVSTEMGAPAPQTAGAVYDQSSKNAESAMRPAQSAPVIVSAPTNVSNNNSQSIAMPAPIRNDDNGITKYISKNARYF